MNKAFRVGALVVAVLVGMLPALAQDEGARLTKKLLAVGAAAPGFELKTPEGKSVSLGQTLSDGKLTLVVFWFKGCVESRDEVIALQKHYKEWRQRGLRVLTVNHRDDADTLKEMWRESKLTMTALMNGEGDQDVAEKYGVTGFPTNYLLSPDGKVVASFVGYDEKRVTDELAKLSPKR